MEKSGIAAVETMDRCPACGRSGLLSTCTGKKCTKCGWPEKEDDGDAIRDILSTIPELQTDAKDECS